MSTRWHDTAYYRELHLKLDVFDDDAALFAVRLFGEEYADVIKSMIGTRFPVGLDSVLDGVALVPTVDPNQAFGDMLRDAMRKCRKALAPFGFQVESSCRPSDVHYRCLPDSVAVLLVDHSLPFAPVAFNLGGTLIGHSAAAVRENMSGTLGFFAPLLEPAGALYCLAQWIAFAARCGVMPATMHIICAGAEYSSRGDRFLDVPCWNVHPPVGSMKGLLHLNWLGHANGQPVHGPGFGLPI